MDMLWELRGLQASRLFRAMPGYTDDMDSPMKVAKSMRLNKRHSFSKRALRSYAIWTYKVQALTIDRVLDQVSKTIIIPSIF